MEDWHHIAQTPSGYHAHRLDPVGILGRAGAMRADDPELSEADAIAEIHGEVAEAIRSQLGFPIRGRWFNREGWNSSLTVGVPHPQLMAILIGARGRSPDIVIDGVTLATEYEPQR